MDRKIDSEDRLAELLESARKKIKDVVVWNSFEIERIAFGFWLPLRQQNHKFLSQVYEPSPVL